MSTKNVQVEWYPGEVYLDEQTGDLDYNEPEAEVYVEEYIRDNDDAKKIIEILVAKTRKAVERLDREMAKYDAKLEKAKVKSKEIKRIVKAYEKSEGKTMAPKPKKKGDKR